MEGLPQFFLGRLEILSSIINTYLILPRAPSALGIAAITADLPITTRSTSNMSGITRHPSIDCSLQILISRLVRTEEELRYRDGARNETQTSRREDRD